MVNIRNYVLYLSTTLSIISSTMNEGKPHYNHIEDLVEDSSDRGVCSQHPSALPPPYHTSLEGKGII